MSYTGENVPLKKYIKDEIRVLKDLCLWSYLSKTEQQDLKTAQNENTVNRLMRRYRDKYYDTMLEEYEETVAPKIDVSKQFNIVLGDHEKVVDGVNIYIRDMNLSNRTMGALLRNSICTLQEFSDFVTKYGWSKLKGFGTVAAREIISMIIDDDGEEVDKLVENLKEPSKNIYKYQM